MFRIPFRRQAALAALALAAGSAQATWSIVLVNPSTGEIAVGSATCLINLDLRALTPVLIPEIGTVTAQSSGDGTGINRTFIRDRLMEGVDPEEILTLLSSFDGGHQSRQYGMGDTLGGIATFTGTGAGDWAGGLVGSFDTPRGEVYYAIQGNVLTGAPVVGEAVVAAIATEGDLAEKLMAGMEAARLYGGDGRCSCSQNDPEACGSPPPEFEKSAHIAYMMVARAGDTSGCHGVYRVGSQPFEAALLDVDGDGTLDILATTSSGFAVLPNTTMAGDVFVTTAPRSTYGTASLRGIATGNVTGAALDDVVVCAIGDDQVLVHRSLGDGTFDGGTAVPTGDGPFDVIVADLDGQHDLDIATVNSNDDTVTIALSDGAGGFLPSVQVPVGASPFDLDSADMDGDGDIDLIVAERTATSVTILANDGSGSFAPAETIAFGGQVEHVVATDLGGDGRVDLAVTLRLDRSFEVLIRADEWERTTYAIDGRGRPVSVIDADFDGDGATDLMVTDDQSTNWIYTNAGGTFVPEGYDVAGGLAGPAVGDLNGDGVLDAAIIGRTQGAAIMFHSNPDGTYTDGIGCASGDYWLNLNVPDQRAADPDPVFQLRDMFDDWRTGLADVTDAVRSRVDVGPTKIAAGAEGTLRVTLRTYAGVAPIGVQDVEVVGTRGLIEATAVTDMGGGIYDVTVEAGDVEGVETFEVRVDHGDRTIVLMPRATLEVAPAVGDFDGDGNVWIFDLILFLGAFEGGDASADLNGDTVLDINDVLVMVDAID
ncbi:MAG: VCBS repeat-containing protein [Phycisphaerales bacterium]|nr:VCBS repeat-containing protein [Phycisphaerales bacterium]